MSHEEPRRDILPSRLADVSPAAAVFARAERAERFDDRNRFEPPSTGSRGSATEWIGRACRRHWWRIVPLWLLASAGIWLNLARWFPNTYEATSVVQVDSGSGAGVPDRGNGSDFATFKETQASRIVAPNVVKAALQANPDLGKQLALDTRTDPESAILRGISAVLRPKTDLIQVTMTAPKDDGLAAIVDGVIKAYLGRATSFNEEGVAQRSIRLRNLAKSKEDQVQSKRLEVARMVGKNGGAIDGIQGRDQHKIAIEQRAALADQLLKTDLEVGEEQARFERLQHEEAAAAEAMAANPPSRTPSESEAIAAFYRLAEVVAITGPLDEARRKLELANREPGKAGEATRKTWQPKVDDLQRQVDNLWFKLKPGLMVAAQAEPRDKPPTESSKLAVRLDGLKARQALLKVRLDTMTRETLAGGSEVLALEYAHQDLRNAEALLDSMTPTLSQAEMASDQPIARFNQEYLAKTTEQSQRVPRWALGVVGPGMILLGLLGFFGLVEKQTGRILDPSDLPAKVRLNVIAVVPPLPRGRGRLGLTSGSHQRSQVDVERFIQSLDQLRVLVCGRGDSQGRHRRSLLITSAGENEGKSTLAAQLAERSVNAGLLTLLIDADLRNPTLSRMFDRPESVGLANVLRGELLAEEAIGTVPEAGGFHFLSAGLVRDDLSRLLQSERLARLLESARESFDLVLVDSPPVLPVADALTIGQWVDAAILTVRHKVSRLPLVERASRQLTSVGITILGAVVSGVKDRHTPLYGSRPGADPDRVGSVDSLI